MMLPRPASHRHQNDQMGARVAAAAPPVAQLLQPSNSTNADLHYLQQQQQQHQHSRKLNSQGMSSHPIYRAQSFSSAVPSASQYTHQENLLRRKTPSGTLPAAYDAAPMDWSTRPTKHILLPRPPSNSRQEPQLTGQHVPWENEVSLGARSWESTLALRGADAFVGSGSIAPAIWAAQPSSQISLDDNLDPYVRQFLLQQNQMVPPASDNVYAGGRPSGFQPFYNPITAPTASCEDFNLIERINYNPVPRDSNWYGHYGVWGNGNTTPTQLPQAPMYYTDSVYTPSPHQMNGPTLLWTSQRLPAVDSIAVSAFPSHIASPYPHNSPSINTPEAQLQHLQLDGPSPNLTPQDTTSPHFRDKVLSWAHGVYVELLASLQANQRQADHTAQAGNRVGSHLKPGLFPLNQLHLNNWRTNNLCSPQPSLPIQNRGCGDPGDRRKRMRVGLREHLRIGTSSSHSNDDSPCARPDGVRIYDGNDSQPELWADQLHEKKQSRGCYFPNFNTSGGGGLGDTTNQRPSSATASAVAALDALSGICAESSWTWLDGMLLGGCLAYGLGELHRAINWYSKILDVDDGHVGALSNLAATLLSLNRRDEAEQYWLRAVKRRPSYFEAVEHLVALLCGEQRGKEAIDIINFVESNLRRPKCLSRRNHSISSTSSDESTSPSLSSSPELKFDYEIEDSTLHFAPTKDTLPFGSNGFLIPSSDNGRMLALVHAKGNMLYTLGDNAGAAKAFGDAVLLGAGMHRGGIKGLINKILSVLRFTVDPTGASEDSGAINLGPVLLTPDQALHTAKLVFPPAGELPGLQDIPTSAARRAGVSTTSNSLLSLAKIFQDGMSSGQSLGIAAKLGTDVKGILALYYLSLSLHPSPSTANNVGILLASVQQASAILTMSPPPLIPSMPGVGPVSGVTLALTYYHYGLRLDSRHAHLYTNLGSLLKDMNQLNGAIMMYEQAVSCDPNFDIALANLANAVKDQGRISDAIGYYRRAVKASPGFAEAVCGLANALNSVCDWKGRGGVVRNNGNRDRWHVDDDGMLVDAKGESTVSSGWMKRVVEIVEKQLVDGEHWGKGVLADPETLDVLLRELERADGRHWSEERRLSLRRRVEGWVGKGFEGAKVIRLIERASRRTVWRWYREKYIDGIDKPRSGYARPTVPPSLSTPSAPTVLPFHTFTCPLSAKQVRMISQRNGLRISCSTLRAQWLQPQVYPPPAPPAPFLKVGYVSSDFNNHPLAHLMQSVFGLHDPTRARAYCYATTAGDGSEHRRQIERESPVFVDAHNWGPDRLVQRIVDDGIHILINLNGFTRGARNEIFAARPAPIQMSFMGFAGTLGAEWCDYLYADSTAVPPETLRPWRRNVDLEDEGHEDTTDDNSEWVYSENIIFARYSFFCCDHRQSAPDSKSRPLSWEEEQTRRWNRRKELFPQLSSDAVILGNFNQLYKIEPTTFRTWLRILARAPKAVLWLLRFPELGESNLRALARAWAGEEVASRILFTDVAPKLQHISRAQVCDVFLDTPECNAHTTAADVIWSGTPLLTYPRHKHKMCSRIAASILRAAVPQTNSGRAMANSLIVGSEQEYEDRAVELVSSLVYDNGRGVGELGDIRKVLFEHRWQSALFDTRRWVRDLEDAYAEAWRRWVHGEGGDIYLTDL